MGWLSQWKVIPQKKLSVWHIRSTCLCSSQCSREKPALAWLCNKMGQLHTAVPKVLSCTASVSSEAKCPVHKSQRARDCQQISSEGLFWSPQNAKDPHLHSLPLSLIQAQSRGWWQLWLVFTLHGHCSQDWTYSSKAKKAMQSAPGQGRKVSHSAPPRTRSNATPAVIPHSDGFCQLEWQLYSFLSLIAPPPWKNKTEQNPVWMLACTRGETVTSRIWAWRTIAC